MKPTPFEVFCGYYLGLDREFRYKFMNQDQLARVFGMHPDELRAVMDEYHLIPERTRHVDYNLAKAHADAQEIAMFGHRDDLIRFARKTFQEFIQAMGGYDETKDFENVDYDHLLPDPPAKDDPDPLH